MADDVNAYVRALLGAQSEADVYHDKALPLEKHPNWVFPGVSQLQNNIKQPLFLNEYSIRGHNKPAMPLVAGEKPDYQNLIDEYNVPPHMRALY